MRNNSGKKYMTSRICKKLLSDKIAINITEFKEGRYVSKPQAIAVSYSQIKKKYPSCKNKLDRRSKRKSKKRSRSKTRSKRKSRKY